MRLVSVTAVLLTLSTATPTTHAQLTLNGKTAGEMKQVVSEALAAGRRIGAMQPRIGNGQIVFDITLVPNPASVEWMMLLNMNTQQFNEARTRYEGEGYTLGANGAVNANGQQYFSAVWLRSKAVKRPLVLPVGALPESGDVVPGMEAVDEAFRDFMRKHNAAGATVAIAREGQIVYSRAFGWADATNQRPMKPDTPMRIADVSRTLTAVAAMQLIEKRKLFVYEPVVSILRKGKVRGATTIKDARFNVMTVQHVLHNTGGFKAAPVFMTPLIIRELRLNKPATRSDIVRYQLRQPLAAQPGSTYAYMDFGYSLLGRIVEVAADQSYGSYVREHILEPAGMTRTRLGRTKVEDRPRPEAYYHMQNEKRGPAHWSRVPKVARAQKIMDAPDMVREPDGMWSLEVMDSVKGWTSTADDLVRFMTAIESTDSPLIAPATRDAMLQAPLGKENTPEWYGAGWFVRSDKKAKRRDVYHHGALPGTSATVVRTHENVVWAVLFNTDLSTTGKTLAAEIDPVLLKTLAKVTWPK